MYNVAVNLNWPEAFAIVGVAFAFVSLIRILHK